MENEEIKNTEYIGMTEDEFDDYIKNIIDKEGENNVSSENN